ncbi:hypothetical protein ECZU36_17460 [Escherichia coli]|nr:hypothetical protein ECZU36_17460 [Escherichia coli]
MAASTAKGKVPLKIHLPELVRRVRSGPSPGCRNQTGQKAIAGHQVMHRAEGGQNKLRT